MVNDSAGTDVILVDKSQRPSDAAGFRAAVAIEAERGLCNKPVLITSTDDFVKVYGNPSLDKYGQANMEAYFLAQNNVPLVISRAKNPSLTAMDTPFGGIQIQVKDGKLSIREDAASNGIRTPTDADTAMIYFKGEGRYCSKIRGTDNIPGSNLSNIVLRFSKPATQSAYAESKRVLQLQVYDFAGARHIDADTDGILGITPDFEPVLGGGTSGNGDQLALDGYDLVFDGGASGESENAGNVIAWVNGCKGVAPYTGQSVYDAIAAAVLDAKDSDDNPVIESFESRGDGTFKVVAGTFNCFNLSISLSIQVRAQGMPSSETGTVKSAYYNYGCGSVAVTPNSDGESATVDFSLSAGLYLENRSDYMYLGDENAVWAACYAAYLKESYITSFSYDDYDPSYVSMQLDTVLASSNYLSSRTSEVFGDYAIDFVEDYGDDPDRKEKASPIVANLTYFDPNGIGISSNEIDPGQRSYAYSLALREIMGNNLTIWRCVVTPNLGDVMNVPDFQGVVDAAAESTLGVSNMGKAASLDAFHNMRGRHGYRFVADFSQYGRRVVAGRRMWLTMAALMTLRLNINFENGNEARPPMGINYGQINCDALSEEFTGPQRKMLAQSFKVNPAIDENGIYMWEETTSQLADSALSDIHVILSYCWMKYQIYESMRTFVAEYNDPSTVSEGLRVLNGLNKTFISRKYILEGKPNADKNVIGDKVMRFDFPVRFMGVARYVDIYVTAYPQTQSLEISLAEEA